MMGSKVILTALDREDRAYNTRLIKLNHKMDVCLLHIVDDHELPFLRLSIRKPQYAEKVFNLGGPLGIMDKEMVPAFEGYFFGDSEGAGFYSLPTAPGASGSPIINLKGDVVGVIHSVHYRFHHIALSVRYTDLWNFLKN